MDVKGTEAYVPENRLDTGKVDENHVYSSYQKGQMVEGIISDISDQVSINFSGRELKFPKEAVQDAKEGEVRKYRIMDVSDKSIVLKEVEATKSSDTNYSGILFTNVETGQTVLAEHAVKGTGKNATLAKQVMKKLASSVSKDDYEELAKERTPFEEYQAERLERAIIRVKENRRLKKQHVEDQVEELKNDKEVIKKMSVKAFSKQDFAGRAQEFLVDADLPVTKENVDRFRTALDRSESVSQVKDTSIAYLIRNNLEPSIENIYKAVHSGAGKSNIMAEENWNAIKPSAEAVIQEAGFALNDDTLQDARWILQERLPLTAENLQYKKELETLAADFSVEKAIPYIMEAMENQKSPIDAVLSGRKSQEHLMKRNQVTEILTDFHKITEDAVKEAVELKYNSNNWGSNSKPVDVTLAGLKEAMEKLSGGSLNEVKMSGAEVQASVITAKRQLEEIRLMMTVEAGVSLQAKGIHLDTDSLTKIVDGLKELEQEYYGNLAKETGLLDSAGQMSLLKETLEGTEALKKAPVYILGTTFQNRQFQTLQTLQETGKSMASRLERAGEAYETLMTSPRKDLGDSIQKAFQNVDVILDDLKLELTEANQRAVRILGYNQMEITAESIISIKNYDNKVMRLIESLQPAAAAELIKNDINPMELPLDELSDKLEQLGSDLGNREESYSRFLVELEQKKGITEEERQAYIGLYRLLYQVERNDHAAVGFLAQAGQELTLKNLLLAVRTMKHGKMDISVQDGFGALSESVGIQNSISSQINSAFQNQEKELSPNLRENETKVYYESLISGVLDTITPDSVINLMQGKQNQESNRKFTGAGGQEYDLNLEEFLEYQRNADKQTQTAYAEKEIARLQVAADADESIYRFLDQFDMAYSVQNLLTAKELLGGRNIFRDIEDLRNSQEVNKEETQLPDFLEALEQKETIEKAYSAWEEQTKLILNNAYEKEVLSSADLAKLREIRNGMQFIRTLNQKEHYEIPIQTEEGITNISLTIQRKSSEGGKVSIRIPQEESGIVSIEFSAIAGKINGLVRAEKREGLMRVKEEQQNITEEFQMLGFEMDQLHFVLGNTEMNVSSNQNFSGTAQRMEEAAALDQGEQVRTDSLFKLAKVVIQKLIGGQKAYEN